MFASVTKMKYFRNISSIMCGVNAKPAKGLCNLLIFNNLQSIAVGKRPRLRRDCDSSDDRNLVDRRSRKKTSIKKGLRQRQLLSVFFSQIVGKRPRLRRDCDLQLRENTELLFLFLVGKRPRLRRDCDRIF